MEQLERFFFTASKQYCGTASETAACVLANAWLTSVTPYNHHHHHHHHRHHHHHHHHPHHHGDNYLCDLTTRLSPESVKRSPPVPPLNLGWGFRAGHPGIRWWRMIGRQDNSHDALPGITACLAVQPCIQSTHEALQVSFLKARGLVRRRRAPLNPTSQHFDPTNMSFGYSVGDGFMLLQLVWRISRALSEVRGVKVELQQINSKLTSLGDAINNAVTACTEWDRAYPDQKNHASLNALLEEHRICQHLLQDFWAKSEKFTSSILTVNGRPKSKVDALKRGVKKIQWCIFHPDDIVVLDRSLNPHVMAINIYSNSLRWYAIRRVGLGCRLR